MANSTATRKSIDYLCRRATETPFAAQASFLIFVAVTTLLGNLSVCLTVFLNSSLHTFTTYLVASLALSDLMVATLSLPFRIHQTLHNTSWCLGEEACLFWIWADLFCCCASIGNLALISIDRFLATKYPLRYQQIVTRKTSWIMLSSVWIYSLIVASSGLTNWTFPSGTMTIIINGCYKPDPYFYTFAAAVILRDTRSPGEFAFFIRSGQCQVVREMILVRRRPPVGKRRLILPPVMADDNINPKFKIKNYDQVKKYFLVIGRLGEGDCFGVGQDLTKMSIVSVKKVEVVLVPRNVIIKHDKGRSIEEMRQQLDREFPSRMQVFRGFVTGEKWQHYKLDVLDKLRTNKWLLNPTTLEDVPKSVRKQCLHQHEFYTKKNRLPPVR